MLIISHTDVNHTDTGNSPQNTQTYMKTVEDSTTKTCGPNSPNDGIDGPRPSRIHFTT